MLSSVIQLDQELDYSHGTSTSSGSFGELQFLGSVGRLMESVAVTLDDYIGNALEEWNCDKVSSPKSRGSHKSSKGPLALVAPGKLRGNAGMEDIQADSVSQGKKIHQKGDHLEPNPSPFPEKKKMDVSNSPDTVTSSQWADFCFDDTQTSNSDTDSENKDTMNDGGKTLNETNDVQNQISKLQRKVTYLKRQVQGYKNKLASDARGSQSAGGVDIETQMTRSQIEHLMAEKSQLIQENDVLKRENARLKELVEYFHMGMMSISNCNGEQEEDSDGRDR